MDTESLYFGRLINSGRLMEIIQEKQAALEPVLLSGHAIDFADYKDRAAYLRALSDVVKWMNEISREDERTHGSG